MGVEDEVSEAAAVLLVHPVAVRCATVGVMVAVAQADIVPATAEGDALEHAVNVAEAHSEYDTRALSLGLLLTEMDPVSEPLGDGDALSSDERDVDGENAAVAVTDADVLVDMVAATEGDTLAHAVDVADAHSEYDTRALSLGLLLSETDPVSEPLDDGDALSCDE